MMRVLGAFALTVCAATAQAETFGNAAGCARAANQPETTDGVVYYDGDVIHFYESSCPVTGVLQVGSGATSLTVSCTGEGETWEDYFMLMTTAKPDRLILFREESPELNTELQLCDVQ